jgi:hypothetical protein
MKILSAIVNVFKRTAVVASEVFVRLFGKDTATKFAAASLALLESEAGKLVLAGVKEVETMIADGTLAADISNAAKREYAFQSAERAIKDAGITVGTSVLNMLIELAVQSIERNIAAA